MLVKIVLLIIFLTFSFAYDKNSVDKIFENLMKQKFNEIEVGTIANPFEKIDLNISKNLPINLNSNNPKQIEVKEKVIPKLKAIFNNRVKLEDKWYGVGDEIFGFKIVEINVDRVVLRDKDGEENLSLIKNNESIRIFNEIR